MYPGLKQLYLQKKESYRGVPKKAAMKSTTKDIVKCSLCAGHKKVWREKKTK